MGNYELNAEVTKFLDHLSHPLRNEIEYLRRLVMSADLGLMESVKWNGPNYGIEKEDRITFRIHPQQQIQIIFHRGAKVKEKLTERLITDEYRILTWKENDRAIFTFKTFKELEQTSLQLQAIVVKWIKATT